MSSGKNKLLALYPERELIFGELVVKVRAVPGLRAGDLMDLADDARKTLIDESWPALYAKEWPKVKAIIADCVTFVDESDIQLDELPLGPLGEIVQAVRDLTYESVGGNSAALPQAIGRIYGLTWVGSTPEPAQTESGPTSPT